MYMKTLHKKEVRSVKFFWGSVSRGALGADVVLAVISRPWRYATGIVLSWHGAAGNAEKAPFPSPPFTMTNIIPPPQENIDHHPAPRPAICKSI